MRGHGEPFPYEEKGVTMVTLTARPLVNRQTELMDKYRRRYSDVPAIKKARTVDAMLTAFEAYRRALINDANNALTALRKRKDLSSDQQSHQMHDIRRKLTEKLEKLCTARDNLRLTK